MDTMRLVADLQARPELAGMTNAEVAAWYATAVSVQGPVPIKQVLRWSAETEGIFVLREAAGGGNKDKRRLADAALQLVNHPHVEELDVTDPEVVAMLGALIALGVFTAPQVDSLKARGVSSIRRDVSLGIGTVTVGDIQRARFQMQE